MTLRNRKSSRKARLKAACVLAGITIQEFAREAEVTTWHLSEVLDGHRESQRVSARVDAFIATQFARESAA